MSHSITVVEDEPDISDLIVLHLEREGFQVSAHAEGRSGLEALVRSPPDLVVLDLMIPGLSGLEICKELRRNEETRRVPILIVSARAEEADIVCGLELGADDYVTKPFSPRVLIARVRNLLRRASAPTEGSESRIRLDRLEVDTLRFEVRANDELLELTRTEFRILYFLCKTPGRVRARAEILEKIDAGPSLDRTVDVHIASLRRKLGDLGENIQTVRGVGYRYRDGGE